ncbi:MAG: hypothetical protein ACRC8C_02965 [Mycoplasmoidaceae bacterium]
MKKKSIKNNLKYILIGIAGILPLTAVPFLALFPNNNNLSVNEVNTKFLNTGPSISPNLEGIARPELQNAIYQDALEKATYDPDSILVYSIYWFGVFHRFGLVSHILSVLDINPNQKIYVMETSGINDYSTLLANDELGNRKYPNVKIIETAPGFDTSDNVWLLSNRFVTPIDFFKQIYKENPEPRIHAYFADLTILYVIGNFFNGSNLPLLKKNLYDFWGLFNKFESFNLFADGTGSVEFFDTDFYNYLKKAGIGKYELVDPINNRSEYKEAANFRKDFLKSQKEGKDFLHKFLEKNNAIMYIASLITTKDFNNDNFFPEPHKTKTYPDSKFFLPTTQFIDDINRPNSTFLKTSNNDYLNPYNSYEADLLESFKHLKPDKFDELTKILKSKDVFEDPNLSVGMENKVNVVYSGTLLNNSNVTSGELSETRRGEVNNLRAIDIITRRANPGKQVQIIYKGHPRDKTPQAIEQALEETRIDLGLKPGDLPDILIVDPVIPYELYLFSGLFDADPLFGKEVKLYSSFSTIIWFLYADGRVDDIINVAVTDSNKKYIENVYGLDSPMFNTKNNPKPNDKLITTEELLLQAGIK